MALYPRVSVLQSVDIAAIQRALADEGLDGWLLYDFHGLNPIARQIAGIKGIVTRRWFVMIPKIGDPHAISHAIEGHVFDGFPGLHHTYRSWQELDDRLRGVLTGCRRVAMEYSPDCAIPYVARVDAGTIENIRSFGIEVASSADLVARFAARWSSDQIASHRDAAKHLMEIKDAAFTLVSEHVRTGKRLTEFDLVAFVRDQFQRRNIHTDEGPICAVGPNAGNPHYEPTAEHSQPIRANMVVLLDIWAKTQAPDSVYADITWMGYTGATVPKDVADVFAVVAAARDRAVGFLNERLSQGHTVAGCEVDRVVRDLITEKGFGDHFIHRTGHSLGTDVHGIGPNIDDFETQDRRRLQDGTAFTIEPGIYLPKFGVRSEINVLIEKGRAVVTTLPLQTKVITLQ